MDIKGLYGFRLSASFTVENAVIVPVFVVILLNLVMLDFFLHDTVVVKCVAENVALVAELDKENGDESDVDSYVKLAVENIMLKSMAQRTPGTEIESGDDTVLVKSHGSNPSVMLNVLGKDMTSAQSSIEVEKPDNFVRKVNAVKELLDTVK